MIPDLVHPDYDLQSQDLEKWRITYEGGCRFIDRYLRKLSKRETTEDFADRRAVTYCPAFAKVGVNEIKDSIYQRMADITRAEGSPSYQTAITGLFGGVDLEGSSMNYFMGCKILPELLTMQKVGIFVDMPPLNGESLAANADIRPYIYYYRAEDIRTWIIDEGSDSNEYTAILLREYAYTYDGETGFPTGCEHRFRRVWRDVDGLVWACFYNSSGQMTDQYGGLVAEPILLKIDKVPFVCMTISESLLTDVADYQIALLNLASTDMGYVIKSNFPFYTEQRDQRADSPHLKQATTGEGEATGQEKTVNVGVTRGRTYPKGLDRPGFIHPSPEPIKASMEKQAQLKSEIRILLQLTIANLQGPKMASAESKAEDSRSLETGLSYIGLALEMGERKVAELWSMYEGSKSIATITYPENYSLRTEEERRAEAEDLEKQMLKIPSAAFQKAMAKRIARIMLGPKVSREVIAKIESQIESAACMTSDPDVIKSDVEIGLVSLELASKQRGYPDGEVEKAKADHAERLARIAEAQTEAQANNAAARGNPDASGDPKKDASAEKTASRDNTQNGEVKDRVRGGTK